MLKVHQKKVLRKVKILNVKLSLDTHLICYLE